MFWGHQRLDLIAVIHGISELNVEKHAIEDHLIRISTELGVSQRPDETSSKSTWQEIGRPDQLRVLAELAKRRDLVVRDLRDQLDACELLERSIAQYPYDFSSILGLPNDFSLARKGFDYLRSK